MPDCGMEDCGACIEQIWGNSTIASSADTFIVWLHLTNQCSLDCSYCYVRKSQESMCEYTARDIIKKLFTTVTSKGYKKIKLKYGGGEPTLQPELLRQIHSFAEELADLYSIKLESNILTNGLMIPEQLIEFSISHHIKWAISLDGIGVPNDIQRLVRNGDSSSKRILVSLNRLQQHGMTPHISITLTRFNLKEIPSFVEFLLEHQLRFSINFFRQYEGSGEQTNLRPNSDNLILALREVYAVIEKHLPNYSLCSLLLDRVNLGFPHIYPCAAGYHYLTIGHQGNIAPCQMLVSQATDFTLDTELPLMPKFEFKNFRNPAVSEKDDCDEGCPWRYFCAGGCPIDAFQMYGRYNVKSPYCKVYRTLAPEVLRLETLRLSKHKHQPESKSTV